MAQPYPLPREIRSTGILAFDGVNVSFRPMDFKIFDIEDVIVYIKHDGDPSFQEIGAVTITKTSGEDYDTFSVTFDEAHPATSAYIVQGERTPERSAAVTKGGGFNTKALEKELSKLAVEDQELRRDLGSSLKYPPGTAELPMPELVAGKVLGVNATLTEFEWLDKGEANFAIPGKRPSFSRRFS